MDFRDYRKLVTSTNKKTRFIRKSRLPRHPVDKSVNGILTKEKIHPMGVTDYCQNPLNIIHFGLFGNDNDEPVRITALRTKGQNEPLTDAEKQYLQRYYALQDKQNERDSRYVINQGWNLSKKLLR